MYKAEPNHTTLFGATHFVNFIVRQVANENSGFGQDAVYSGLTIQTTIDAKIQAAAEEALKRIKDSGEANQGALVCMDPRTGDIRAMGGGLDYKRDQFNPVVPGQRQPGSSFEPT